MSDFFRYVPVAKILTMHKNFGKKFMQKHTFPEEITPTKISAS